MRTLIDGYNVMFAAGLMGRKFGPDGFRRVRTRFLNDVAHKLGPVEAHLTTVVFDAKKVPEGLPSRTRHKGITVIFAVNNPSADEQITEFIQQHSDPKRLMVVSSDNQIKAAARKRKAGTSTADEFLSQMSQAIEKRKEAAQEARPEKPSNLSEEELAYWAEEFGDLERSGELKDAFKRDPMFPSDDEIAQIEREVEREDRERRRS